MIESNDITIDFETSIAPWLGKTSKIIDYYIQEAMKKEGLDLTKEQMIVLKKLNDQDGLPQHELAFLTLRNKSSLTRLLVKMENKEYLVRMQSKDDKRINKVYLTQLGKKTYYRTRPIIKNLMDTLEKNITAFEKQQVIEILQKLQFNLTSTKASL